MDGGEVKETDTRPPAATGMIFLWITSLSHFFKNFFELHCRQEPRELFFTLRVGKPIDQGRSTWHDCRFVSSRGRPCRRRPNQWAEVDVWQSSSGIHFKGWSGSGYPVLVSSSVLTQTPVRTLTSGVITSRPHPTRLPTLKRTSYRRLREICCVRYRSYPAK